MMNEQEKIFWKTNTEKIITLNSMKLSPKMEILREQKRGNKLGNKWGTSGSKWELGEQVQ